MTETCASSSCIRTHADLSHICSCIEQIISFFMKLKTMNSKLAKPLMYNNKVFSRKRFRTVSKMVDKGENNASIFTY